MAYPIYGRYGREIAPAPSLSNTHSRYQRQSDYLEDFFVERINEDYFNKRKLDITIDTNKPISSIDSDIFDAAQQQSDKPTGTVVQHLVGSKLKLRFSKVEVDRDRTNAADQHGTFDTYADDSFYLNTSAH